MIMIFEFYYDFYYYDLYALSYICNYTELCADIQVSFFPSGVLPSQVAILVRGTGTVPNYLLRNSVKTTDRYN